MQPGPTPNNGMSGCLIAFLIVGALGLLAAVATIALLARAVDSVDDAFKEAEERNATEILDIEGCTVTGSNFIEIDLTNNSSKQSSYSIDVNFFDAEGNRIGDEPFVVSYIRPSERLIEAQFATLPDGTETCEVAEVDRYASESPADTGEVVCTITGVDALGDLTTEITVTNGSSGRSDYSIDFAFVRNRVRVGDGSVIIENLDPGESARDDGFTVTDGPVEGTECEVVYVRRTAS